MKHLIRSALRVSIVTATGALAFANDPSAPPPFIMMNAGDLAWPPTSLGWSPPGTFTRTAAGLMNRDTWPDVVMLAGTTPVLLLDPAIYSVYHALPGSANDVDFAKLAGTNQRDAIAVVNSNGLEIIRADNQIPPGYEVVTKSFNEKWWDAIKVRCGDIDVDGDTDYVGVGNSSTEVVGHFEGSSNVYSFTRSSTILDIGLGLFDSDNDLDLVLCYADGLEFVEATASNFGTSIKSFTHPSFTQPPTTTLTMAMGVVPPKSGQSADRARAVVIGKSTSTPVIKKLLTYSVPMTQPNELALPSNPTYVSIAAGDVDADGDHDLVVATQRWFGPTFIRNNSVTPALATAEVFFGPDNSWTDQVIRDWDHENEPTFFDVLTDAAASNNVATPVFAPLNTEDGRADLVIPLQQTTTTLNQNPAAIYLEARPTGTPHGSPPPTEGPYFNPGFIDQPDNPAETARRVYLSLVPGYAPNFPGANGLEVAVWRQANESALLPLTPEYFKIHALADLPSQEGNVGLGVDVMIPNDCFVVGTDSYLLWATITPVYFEGTYPATVDPQTPRPYIGGMTTDENVFCSFVCLNDPTVGIQSMVGNTAPSGWPNLGMDSCGEVDCEQPQNGSWQAPPIAPRRRMPQFQPGTFPTESTVHQVATQNMATINY